MSETEEKRLLLSKVHLKGFKSIEDLTVDLKPGLNILIGKNGSGKSNFLEFIEASIDLIYSKVGSTFKFSELTFASNGGDIFQYVIERVRNFKLNVDKEYLTDNIYNQKLTLNTELIFDSADDDFKRSFNYQGNEIRLGRNMVHVFNRLGYGFFIPSYIKYNLPLKMNGLNEAGSITIYSNEVLDWEIEIKPGFLFSGFHAVYEKFETEFIQAFEKIEQENEAAFKKETYDRFNTSFIKNLVLDQNVIDNLSLFSPIKNLRIGDHIHFLKDEHAIVFDNIRLEFYVNESWLPRNHLSDGTKRLFYIISEVTQKDAGITLIEEPELGIHPHQFHMLMQFLKGQAEDKQIVISTHSPKALDILTAAELDHIIIAHYDKVKGTEIRRMNLDQETKAKKYMEEMFLSDYWLLSDLEEDD